MNPGLISADADEAKLVTASRRLKNIAGFYSGGFAKQAKICYFFFWKNKTGKERGHDQS